MVKKIIIFSIIVLNAMSCKKEMELNPRQTETTQPIAIAKPKVSYYEFAFYEMIRREGVRLDAYTCPAGYKTIGIGQRVYSDTIQCKTLERVRKDAQNVLQQKYNIVEDEFPNLPHNKKLALALFVYNFGETYFKKSDLYYNIKANKHVNKTWKKYVYFRNPETDEMQKSTNLMQSRKTELALFHADDKYIAKNIQRLKKNASEAYISAKTKKS